MRFVIFGLSISSSWGNGHATIWRGLCKALVARGHRIDFFEKDVPYYAQHRDYQGIPGVNLHLYESWHGIEESAKQVLTDADVAMTTSYCPDGQKAASLVLSSAADKRVFYDLDTPVTLNCLAKGIHPDYLPQEGLSDFDLVLSFTGGKSLDLLHEVLGAAQTAPLYGCVDPYVHAPVSAVPELRCDLSYLGTYAADRAAALKSLFIEPARYLPDMRFLVGGSLYTHDETWPVNVHHLQHVAPPQHPGFYCSSRFTLNITRASMATWGYCPSGRLFEAASCGVPILSDPWEGIEEFFTPGSEIIIVESRTQVEEALHMSEARRRELALAARGRVLTCHTAGHRVQELEALLGTAPDTQAQTSRKVTTTA